MTVMADVIVIGAGIAGASAAAEIARGGASVLLLEREAQPGYHSTGRSAAVYIETYGPEQARRLTRAGRQWFLSPPTGAAEHPLMTPLGELLIAYEGEEALIEKALAAARLTGSDVRQMSPAEIVAQIPIIRPERLIGGVIEDGALAMDVDAIHQTWLRLLRSAGGRLECRAEVVGLARRDAHWTVATADGRQFVAPTVVNAAGAWADVVGDLAGVAPIGLQPKRRTGVMIELPAGTDSAGWPVVGDLAETWYFKPEVGRLMISPADATPTEPQDVQPEELDVAIAIDRFMAATTVEVRRPLRTWAGLRSFVADKELVIGFDPTADGFCWLAGQGGYGIQSCVGAAKLAASLVLGQPLPEQLAGFGVVPAAMSPARPALRR